MSWGFHVEYSYVLIFGSYLWHSLTERVQAHLRTRETWKIDASRRRAQTIPASPQQANSFTSDARDTGVVTDSFFSVEIF